MSPFFNCPVCGARVSSKAPCCPQCGSDHETGWSPEAQYIHLLPDRPEDSFPPSGQSSWWKRLMIFMALVTFMGYLASRLHPFAVPLAIVAVAIVYFFNEIYPRLEFVQQQGLYRQLLRRAGGNRGLAERLIDLERNYNPRGKRLEWMRRAIERWDRDQ